MIRLLRRLARAVYRLLVDGGGERLDYDEYGT